MSTLRNRPARIQRKARAFRLSNCRQSTHTKKRIKQTQISGRENLDTFNGRPMCLSKVENITVRVILCLSAFMLTACTDGRHLSFLDPQGPIAAIQRRHFFDMLGLLGVFVALPIFILIPWFVWRYRYRAQKSEYKPDWQFSGWLDVVSWSGPVVIVMLLAVLVWRSTHTLDPYKPLASNEPVLHLQVIAYDWKWLFLYPDLGIASIGRLPLPLGQPVAMEITSATVMQSLHIPALGSQIYAMGGMVTQLHLMADKPGQFLGENTMYNGDGFHSQHFTAEALPPAAFRAWVKRVQRHGVPLDAKTLKLLARPSTKRQFMAALGQSPENVDSVYFNHVSRDIFHSIVKETVDGTVSVPQTNGRIESSRTAAMSKNLSPS